MRYTALSSHAGTGSRRQVVVLEEEIVEASNIQTQYVTERTSVAFCQHIWKYDKL